MLNTLNLTNLSPKLLQRYRAVLMLMLRYGGLELLRSTNLEDSLLDDPLIEDDINLRHLPEQLAEDLESLGPTFIKIGQLLSTRPDLLPKPYIVALTRLQDQIEPFPFSQVEEIIIQELGLPPDRLFAEFSDTPIAAASLGQVHRATLLDGRQVAVKIQRPGIRGTILQDFELFHTIATTVDTTTTMGRRFAFKEIVDEFRKTLLRELDYRREAQNLRTIGQTLAPYKRLIVPVPIDDYSTSRVLTMDYIVGTKISNLSPLTQRELDGQQLATDLSRAYLDQVLVEGFFHADPHPGNVFITHENKLALLDMGMVAYLSPSLRETLLRLLLATTEGYSEQVSYLLRRMGTVVLEQGDDHRFIRRVADVVAFYHTSTMEDVKIGYMLIEMARVCAEHGIRPVPELTILGKTLLHLDEIGRILDPKFNPNPMVRRYSAKLMSEHLRRTLSWSNLSASALEVNNLVQKLPSRLNRILELIDQPELEIKVKAFDEVELVKNLQKVANRITLGLVLAALIIGAALIMDIETEYLILGYPVIALGLFSVAVTLGLALVFNIFINDVWRSSKK